MSLDDVVMRSTSVTARILGYEGTIGTLKPGGNADIAVFELNDGQRRQHSHRQVSVDRSADDQGRARLE
jgi:predicted amidohydrolase